MSHTIPVHQSDSVITLMAFTDGDEINIKNFDQYITHKSDNDIYLMSLIRTQFNFSLDNISPQRNNNIFYFWYNGYPGGTRYTITLEKGLYLLPDLLENIYYQLEMQGVTAPAKLLAFSANQAIQKTLLKCPPPHAVEFPDNSFHSLLGFNPGVYPSVATIPSNPFGNYLSQGVADLRSTVNMYLCSNVISSVLETDNIRGQTFMRVKRSQILEIITPEGANSNEVVEIDNPKPVEISGAKDIRLWWESDDDLPVPMDKPWFVILRLEKRLKIN